MKHDRGLVRHHRERVIANRMRQFGTVIYGEPWKPRGFFSKRKPLDCSCPMCQSPNRRKVYRGKERQAVKQAVWREIA